MFERPGKLSDKLPAPYMNEVRRVAWWLLIQLLGTSAVGHGASALQDEMPAPYMNEVRCCLSLFTQSTEHL